MDKPYLYVLAAIAAVVFILVCLIGGWFLNATALVGNTVVEREVMEQSYQRQAGDEAKRRTLQAEAAQLEQRLRDPDLPSSTRNRFESQLRAIEVQLSTVPRETP